EKQRESDEEQHDDAGRERELALWNDLVTYRLDDTTPERPSTEEETDRHQRRRADRRDRPTPDRRAEGHADIRAADIESDECRNRKPDDEKRIDHITWKEAR